MAGLRSGPSGHETSDALAAVLKDQAARKQRREAAPAAKPPRDWSRIASLAAIPLGVLAAWFVIAPPSFLLPPPVPAPTIEDVRNGLHMDISAAAGQVMDYRARNGRLPASLTDALPDPAAAEDLVYSVRSGGVFEIAGERDGEAVVYVSTESLAEFVASARMAIEVGSGS